MTESARPWLDHRIRSGIPRQLTMRRRMLDADAGHLGWKVGFGAPTSLAHMRLTAPLVGYLTDASVRPPGSIIDVNDWTRPVIEFEVAVLVGKDIPAGTPIDEAAASIIALAPAIEFADIDLPIEPESVEQIIAGNIFHRRLVIGDWDESRAGIDLTDMTARILADGAEQARTSELEAITGSYRSIVSVVAETLAANGTMLRQGDLIITGSVIPPIAVEPGITFTFALDPLDPITVTIAP